MGVARRGADSVDSCSKGSFVPSLPRLLPEEELCNTFMNVSLKASSSIDVVGTLFVTSRRLVWNSNSTTKEGRLEELIWDFRNIILHAISKDEDESSQERCIYCQFETDGTNTSSLLTEARFIPESAEQLQEMFDSFSHAAMLNPDDEEDDDSGWIMAEDDGCSSPNVDKALSDRLDSILTVPSEFEVVSNTKHTIVSGQFDDAEEDLL